jgi:tellurite resistance protein TerC
LNQHVVSYTYKTARRIVVAIVGGTVLLAGVAMIVLPGPATVVIPAGLAILAIEFAWARRWLRRIKLQARQTIRRLNHTRNSLRASATPARQDGKP